MRHPMKRAALATVVAASLAMPATAAGVPFDGAWKTQGFSLFSANSYSFGGGTLGVRSRDSVSLTYRALPRSLWSSASARWTWAVQQGVPATDLTRKGGDDRNLALYFVFLPEGEAERSGGNIRRLIRNDAARVLIYVWGGAHARGAVLPSPYLGSRGRTIVLRGAGTGQARESVDLARDFARAFGGQKTALVGVAVSADSDDTDSAVVASISSLQVQ